MDSADLVLHLPVVVVRVHRRAHDDVIQPVVVEVHDAQTVAEVRPQLVAADVVQRDQVVGVERDLVGRAREVSSAPCGGGWSLGWWGREGACLL